jgi:hypothetical protein
MPDEANRRSMTGAWGWPERVTHGCQPADGFLLDDCFDAVSTISQSVDESFGLDGSRSRDAGRALDCGVAEPDRHRAASDPSQCGV